MYYFGKLWLSFEVIDYKAETYWGRIIHSSHMTTKWWIS